MVTKLHFLNNVNQLLSDFLQCFLTQEMKSLLIMVFSDSGQLHPEQALGIVSQLQEYLVIS